MQRGTPLGITFATDIYSNLYGFDAEPINAAEFRKLILHPVLRQHQPHLIEGLSPVAVGHSIHQHAASTHPDKRFQDMFVGLETGSVRLFKKYMPGKAYPFRPEQWPDVVLKSMELLNKHNWFPFCTFILGLPGETREDTTESLELLFALKDAKWCVVPTLFVPLEDTRLESKPGAKLFELTDLQWEFFFTCWRYNLDFTGRRQPRYRVPDHVPIPETRLALQIPAPA